VGRAIYFIELDFMQCITGLVILDRDLGFLLCRLFATFVFFLGMRVVLLIDASCANRTKERGHLSSSGYYSSGRHETVSSSHGRSPLLLVWMHHPIFLVRSFEY